MILLSLSVHIFLFALVISIGTAKNAEGGI